MRENFKLLRAKASGALAQLPYLARGLALAWRAARGWTILWAALLAAQGLIPVALVYLTRLLVDTLVTVVAARASSSAEINKVVLLAAFMAGLMLLSELLRGVVGWIRVVQSELLQDHISRLIHNKSIAADMAFYDLPEYYDHLHRAREEATYRPVAMLESIGSFLQNGITLIAMGSVLLPYGPWLPVALLISTLPAFYIVLHYTLRQHHWRIRTTADQRRIWYYDRLLTTRENAAELRLFDLGFYFQTAYQGLRSRLRKEHLQLARDQTKAELAAGATGFLITAGAMLWMIWRVIYGLATLGDLALFYQAFNQGQRLMRTLLENVGQLYGNSLFLSNLFEFLALEPRVVSPAQPVPAPMELKSGIRFEHVTFSYPATNRPTLNDFSLTIPAGRITAIVGTNGAGKSTLIKLLCRFYDPDAGQIQFDGIDIRSLSIAELRRLITVLFQEPVRYSVTAGENIALSDVSALKNQAEIEAAACAAGADEIIAHLPDGYESELGKSFAGGSDLSVGEWQRIALARAFLRKAPLIILDEPTSAMDPWSEVDWLERFRRLAAGRTALVITHRFTTAMRADVIHVMMDGRIVESGDHNKLLAQGGFYAQSWLTQMEGCKLSGFAEEAVEKEAAPLTSLLRS